MTQLWIILGGLGVFLLGIVIMTDGLRGVAGDTLRSALKRFTHSPVSGACTGAVSTAILQSSSATTIIAIGFVGAGLLSFPQALGIVFGANIGTTITGWLVALLGFKLNLGTAVMPLILAGVLLHLLGKGRWSHAGMALAGFGLIFFGIATLQAGMTGLEGSVTPKDFPPDTIVGRLQLLLIGGVITLITQSSSAGVATALAAVHSGAISFEQAAAMVIGMDISTTVKAMIASMGGSTDTRRTGYSHVIYNLCTGLGAFLLLSPYVWLWQWLSPDLIYQQSEIALVAFHTGFNVLGVIVVLPFTRQFAVLVERLVPERVSTLERRLDKNLLSEPFVALEAVHSTLQDIFQAQLDFEQDLIKGAAAANPERQMELRESIENTQRYLDHIHSEPERTREWQFLMACMHSLDHMQRLQDRLAETRRARYWQHNALLQPTGETLQHGLKKLSKLRAIDQWATTAETTSAMAGEIAEQADNLREQLMSRIASGAENTLDGELQLESLRWLRRVSDHIWRITHHMQLADEASHRETHPQDVTAASA